MGPMSLPGGREASVHPVVTQRPRAPRGERGSEQRGQRSGDRTTGAARRPAPETTPTRPAGSAVGVTPVVAGPAVAVHGDLVLKVASRDSMEQTVAMSPCSRSSSPSRAQPDRWEPLALPPAARLPGQVPQRRPAAPSPRLVSATRKPGRSVASELSAWLLPSVRGRTPLEASRVRPRVNLGAKGRSAGEAARRRRHSLAHPSAPLAVRVQL